MILTGHQPAYLPWLGYFDKILRSDVYVFVDTVQFEHRSFINRNKIKTANGEIWLTVPVLSKGHRESTLMDLSINNDFSWQKKHFNAINLNYKKAPYFHETIEKIKPFYEKKYSVFVDFCYDFTLFWFQQLKITTPIVRLSEIGVGGTKSELVLNMCKYFNADTYLSGALGRNYMQDADFEKAGIRVEYQDYHPKEYSQLWDGVFLPCMGVIDFVMNSKKYDIIKGA